MKSEIVNKLIRDARFKVKLHGTPLNNQIPLFYEIPPPPDPDLFEYVIVKIGDRVLSVC